LYNDAPKRLYVQALGSSERQALGTVGARNVQYAAGHLLYVDGDRALMARPFDPERRMFTGEPTPVAEQVQTRVGVGGSDAFFSASEAGTLVYQAGPGLAVQLTVKDRGGKALRTLGVPGAIRTVSLAHDERRAAVMVGNAIWIYDLDQDRGQRLQLPEAFSAIWSPDDTQIAFAGLSPGATVADIFRKDLNSATPEEPLLVAEDFQLPADWRSDRLLFVQGSGPSSNNDIWVLPLTGSRRPYPLVQSPHNDTRPKVSPNGRFFAYATDETGRFQVYVAPLPNPPGGVGTTSSTFLPGRMPVSTNGGTSPRWRGDGGELYFVDSAAGMIMAASVDTSQGRITVGRPQPLFPIATDARLSGEYDVFGDGQRFLVRVPQAPDTTLATIVFNWMALVQK
jgi:eukaryotic-like serine/threonine-protein kinase